MINTIERDRITYEYICTMFEKMAENNILIQQNLDKLKKDVQAKMSIGVDYVHYDTF